MSTPLRAAIYARVSTLVSSLRINSPNYASTYRLGAGLLTSTPTRASVGPRRNAQPWTP